MKIITNQRLTKLFTHEKEIIAINISNFNFIDFDIIGFQIKITI